jgi:hypothetical protein
MMLVPTAIDNVCF